MARVIGSLAATAVLLAVLAGSCTESGRLSRPDEVTFGDAELGRDIIGDVGCGSCHVIPGVAGADGRVGPPLTAMARRSFIAGALTNTADNMVTWLTDTQQIEPGTAMPDLGLTDEQARNITAYLFTLD